MVCTCPTEKVAQLLSIKEIVLLPECSTLEPYVRLPRLYEAGTQSVCIDCLVDLYVLYARDVFGTY